MIRDDGSIKSANLPTVDNRYTIRDYGLYRGTIREVIYTDDDKNDSALESGDPLEVVYSVMIIGGERDGQIFNNARMMRSLGGFGNFEETTLKQVEGITRQDLAAFVASADPSLRNIPNLSGDAIYVQFLNGDLHMPVIVGGARHRSSDPEAAKSDGPRYQKMYNGVFTEISKDGEFTWSKDNGKFVPFLINTKNPTQPFVNQFAPIPGQEEALKLSVGNKHDFIFESSLGLTISFDGLKDTFSIETGSGAALNVNGLVTDSFELTTALGTSLKVTGGTSDSIEMSTAFGDSFKLGLGEFSVGTTIGGKFSIDKTGLIKLGNSTGDILQILKSVVQSLSTATYSGFGAPGSNVADLVQALAKITLITG